LTYTARMMHRTLQKGLEEQGLYWGQPQLLGFLSHHEGSTQHDIATALDIRPATLTKMVMRMEETGFIERKKDEKDGRVVRVFLTDQAKKAYELLRYNLEQQDAMAFSGFSQHERTLLADMLGRIRDNVGLGEHPCRRRNKCKI